MLTGERLEVLLRLLMAFISGGILGYERTSKRVDAGFRTHILVCMCSCAVMITNVHSWLFYGTGDPMRMPAQVISGVGFLGAGCILVTRQHRIKGVTTAAGIWAAACLGLCIGAGDYLVAGFVLIIVVLTMTVFRYFDEMIVTKTDYVRLFLEIESISAISGILYCIKSSGVKVNDMEFLNDSNSDNTAVIISVQLNKSEAAEDVISRLKEEKGVVYVSEF